MMDAVGELVRSQGYLFLTALLLGAALCFVYDLFRCSAGWCHTICRR